MKKRYAANKRTGQPTKRIAEQAVLYPATTQEKEPFLWFVDFEIRNFRCFEALMIRPLSRVNLLTGVNGVGKTSILEALFLHAGSFNPSLALTVNFWRGLGSIEELPGMLWKTLFWQFREEEPLRFVGTDSLGKKRTLSITVNPIAAPIIQDSSAPMGLEFARNISRELVLEYQDEQGKVSTIRGIPEVVKRGNIVQLQLRAEPPLSKAAVPGIFLNSWHIGGMDEDVQRFSDLRIRNQDHLVLDVLRHMEPRLEKLEILSPYGTSMIHAHLKGYEAPIPLGLLGDGVRRVTSLVLAISSARSGVLLADEIENGIHHSVMRPLWEGIGLAADLFNTQVIATTHSLECVTAAYEAFSARRFFDLTLHHLDRTDGLVRAIAYDQESLEGALSIPLEVRG